MPATRLLRALVLATAVLATGCTSLLPRAGSSTSLPFDSYAQAQQAAQRIEPFRTRAGELRTLGFDWEGGANVTVVPYPDILARLAPYSGVPMDKLDAGIRQCVLAQSACRAYVYHFEQQSRDREGGFWADFFNLRRQTHVTGWWFDALVVVADDVVLFRNWGGQARTDRIEHQRNPLGPLQPAGEAAGAALLR